MVELRLTTPAAVRSAIAWHLLGNRIPATLGEVTLQPHQLQAVQRLGRMLAEHGGALLADEVGLGKSFVALALARAARAAVIVAPAGTRGTWLDSCRRAGMRLPFVSLESLSRSRPRLETDLVIVDEAHHLRNPATQRFSNAAALCQHARVLLLSATPVQNTIEDYRTLLSLFLGQRALALGKQELASYCMRRDARDVSSALLRLPTVREPVWLPAVADTECLEHILALPPPLPPLDGADGGILLSYTLVRQWSSSRAALRGALRRRLATAAALEDSLRAGRHPTRSELLSWTCSDSDMQLAFPELVVTGTVDEAGSLLAQALRHADAVRDLLEWLRLTPDPDPQRAHIIASTVEHHAGERVILFSEYADTVQRLYHLLSGHVRCAMLTHRGGRVAGGGISRHELLSRFDPATPRRVAASDRIDLLLTTDVLSEGVNLHAASVIIHGDLPWNPARMQQRVGRLRRMGAVTDFVHVYLAPPPAAADRLLRMEQVLRGKLAMAAQMVGLADAILPGAPVTSSGTLASNRVITDTISEWHTDDPPADAVAAVLDHTSVSSDVALVCIRREERVELVTARLSTGGVSTDPDDIAQLVHEARTGSASTDTSQLAGVVRMVEGYLRTTEVTAIVTPAALSVARSRRDTLRRLDGIARRSGRSMKPVQLARVGAARDAACATLPAGAEDTLVTLSTSALSDDSWLQQVTGLAARHQRPRARAPAILAVLLLRA